MLGEDLSIVYKSSCPEKNHILKTASSLKLLTADCQAWMGEGREGRPYHTICLPSPCFPMSGSEGAWFIPGLSSAPSWCWLWAAFIFPVSCLCSSECASACHWHFYPSRVTWEPSYFPKNGCFRAYRLWHGLNKIWKNSWSSKMVLFAKIRRHDCQEATVLSPSRGAGAMETSALST